MDFDWNGKNVLVTGAAGFIGSHLTTQLVGHGANVTALVRYNSEGGRRGFQAPDGSQADVRVIAGDIKDHDAVHKAVDGQDAVLHLAALIGIPYSYAHPYDYVQTNVVGTSHVLNACLHHQTPRVMVTSTSEVYGTACYVPINEEHPLQAQSPYAASKIGADQLALSYHRSFALAVSLVRPFNTFGPRQSMRAVIPTIINQILCGNVVRLGALAPRRDLTYVEDTAQGMLAVAASDKCIGEVTNLGNSKDISIGELAEFIGQLMEKSITIECEEERLRPAKSEVMRLLAGIDKARDVAGWAPHHTLAQGLQKTIEYVSSNPSIGSDSRYHV